MKQISRFRYQQYRVFSSLRFPIYWSCWSWRIRPMLRICCSKGTWNTTGLYEFSEFLSQANTICPSKIQINTCIVLIRDQIVYLNPWISSWFCTHRARVNIFFLYSGLAALSMRLHLCEWRKLHLDNSRSVEWKPYLYILWCIVECVAAMKF